MCAIGAVQSQAYQNFTAVVPMGQRSINWPTTVVLGRIPHSVPQINLAALNVRKCRPDALHGFPDTFLSRPQKTVSMVSTMIGACITTEVAVAVIRPERHRM